MSRINFFEQGRLTRDPEIRRLDSGTVVVKFTIAIDRPKGGGEKETDFLDCIAWRQTGEKIAEYFRKGSPILVQGQMKSRKWTNREGFNVTSWELDVYTFSFVLSDPNKGKERVPLEDPAAEQEAVTQVEEEDDDPFA